jgi:phage gpG-like protein
MARTKEISPDDLGEFLESVERLAENPSVKRGLQRTAEEFVGELGEMMVRSVSPDGRPYAPLKNPRPPGHNQNSGPLIDTGQMMLSLISDAEGHLESIGDDRAEVGTNDFKAIFHQFGTKKMVARPFVGVNDEMADIAQIRVAEDLADQIVDL